MIAVLAETDTCHVCKTAVACERAFCRVHEEEHRFALCGPHCARVFLLSPRSQGEAAECHHSVVDEILAEWRWRELGE
jgi:hypothetical protein